MPASLLGRRMTPHLGHRATSVYLLTGCLLLPTLGSAQEADLPPEDTPSEAVVEVAITVSANRWQVPASHAGSSVSVIAREEIEQRNQIEVADYLRTLPGVTLTQTGGPGKSTSLGIRGGTNSQVLVLVDGVRVNTVNNGDVDFSNLMADNIERIEVLRGPQATYGSEAMSGVISIFTRRGEPGWRGSLTAEGGSDEHERFILNASGAKPRFDYSLSGSDWSTDGVSQLSPELGGTEDDPYQNTTLSGRFGLRLPAKGRADLSLRSYDGDTALDGFGVEDLNANSETRGDSFSLSAETSLTKIWRQSLRVSRNETDLLGSDPDTFFNNYDIRSKSTNVESQADVFLTSSNTLDIGYSYEDRAGSNLGGFDESASLNSWYLQDQWSPRDNLHWTGAVRYDEHSVFGSETTYRLTASASFNSTRTRLHGSLGSAFRAPNFNELYFPFAGDPNLRPETSSGFDIGLEHRLSGDRLSFDLTYFELDSRDLIQFDLSSFLFNNVARADSSGIELMVRYKWSDNLGLDLSHTYNDTEDLASNQPLARRPKNRSTLVARYTASTRWSGAAMATSVRDRVDSSGTLMDDYDRLDLNLRYEALSWLRVFLRVQNGLNQNYEEVPGFTTAGRTFVIGINVFQR